MYKSDDYYKRKLFNSWFSKVTKFYKEMRNGKTCDIVIIIKHAPFIQVFNGAYRRNIAHYDTPTDCYSDCMLLMWEGLLKFDIKDDSTWQSIADGTDKENLGKLIRYLKTYVRKEMNWLNSDYVETTKLTIEDGVRHITHVFYRVTPASLHHLITPKGTSERVEIGATVENSYWTSTQKAKCSLFHEWLNTCAEDLLKPSHKKLLATLRDANYSTFERPTEEYEKVDTRNLKARLKGIYDLLTSSYLKEEKFLTGGFVLQELRKEYDTLAKYIDIFNNQNIEVEELPNRLAKHILNSMDSRYWEHIIYDMLPSNVERAIIKEYQRTTLIHEPDFRLYGKRIILSNAILNTVTKVVNTRLNELTIAMEQEIQYLEMLGVREEKPVKLMYFELPEKGKNKLVYLDVSPDGIMFQRHNRNGEITI